MNYDKNSFLSGVAVGRQLKGWSAGSARFEIGLYAGWTADAKYTRTAAGRIGQYSYVGDGVTLEDSGLSISTSGDTTLSGNTVAMSRRFNGFTINSSEFPVGAEIEIHTTILSLAYGLHMLPTLSTDPTVMSASGVWFIHDNGVHTLFYAETLGSGSLSYVKDDSPQAVYFYTVGYDGASGGSGVFTVDSLTVAYNCFKSRRGCCVCVFARYVDGGGVTRLTPCLISGVKHFTYCSYTDGGAEETGLVTTHTLDGMTFYMSSEASPAADNGKRITGAQTVDLTGGDAITTKDALFAAVANAVGLEVWTGLPG